MNLRLTSSDRAPRRSDSSRGSRAFTLVEMLVVMAIVAILLAVTVPALKGIHGAGSKKSAVRTLMGVLDQARMLAISDGRATYVVFAGSKLANTACDSLLGRAYALYEDDADYNPIQRSAWINLPLGVSFKMANDFDTTINRPLTAADQQFKVVNPKGAASPTPLSVQLPYIKFDPTGAVDGTLANDATAQHFRVLFFEGVIDSAGLEVPTKRASGAAGQNAILDEVRINTATGRAKYTLDPTDNLPPKAS